MPFVSARYVAYKPTEDDDPITDFMIEATDEHGVKWHLPSNNDTKVWNNYVQHGGKVTPYESKIETDPPALTSLNPPNCFVGDESFTLRCIGSKLTEATVINFNGFDEPTQFVSGTEVATGVTVPLFVVPAIVPVYLKRGGMTSQTINFEFKEAETRKSR